MIQFDQVHKTFPGGVHAVKGVSLQVKRGECCVLLGTSGAGKSTLLRMVNGLTEPTSGTVSVAGQVVDRRSMLSIRRQVGTVHQRFNLSPRLSVLDNVLCGALCRVGTVRSLLRLFPLALKRKACELLAQVGLDESQLDRRAADLSGGQQQRVAIARAFMSDPILILADEPVASLDPSTSRRVLDLLRTTCQHHGTTILCTLHQVDLARTFADRIVAMAHGQVIFDGTGESLTDEVEQSIYAAAAKQETKSTSEATADAVMRRPSPLEVTCD